MKATMMHTPMTVQLIMQHGAQVFPRSRVGVFDGNQIQHTSYAEVAENATRLASGLAALGVRPGDRVGTFSWNNTAHMEAYLAIPAMGAIMHTVNIRLSPEHIAYVINHAEDRVIILVGGSTEQLPSDIPCYSYEALLAGSACEYDWPVLDETSAAAVCYTSGTTGNPKGVVYSHRTTFVHSMARPAAGGHHQDGRRRETDHYRHGADHSRRPAARHRRARPGYELLPDAGMRRLGCRTGDD